MVKIGRDDAHSREGDQPYYQDRPVRARGYYRGVKRGVSWAVEISKKTGISFCFAFMYRRVNYGYFINKPNPLLKLISPGDTWVGKYFPVPLVYMPGYSGKRKRQQYRKTYRQKMSFV